MGITTTKELRWNDPGAPTLTGTAGSFRVLIKTLLLDCGWSVEWEDAGAQKLVMRNSLAHEGSGACVRILDDGSSAGGVRVARIDVYEDMSDIDTGTGYATGGWVWKDRTGSGGPNAYTLHADERTFWFTSFVNGATPPVTATGSAGGHYTCIVGGGDIAAAIAGDSGVFCVAGVTENPSTGTNVGMESSLGAVNASTAGVSTSARLARNSALAATPTNLGILLPGSISTNGIGGQANSLIGSNPSPGFTGAHFMPALCGAGGTFRGRLRGLYIPLNNWLSGSGGAHVGTTHTPLGIASPSSLAALAYSSTTTVGSSASGRLFVARGASWDDV